MTDLLVAVFFALLAQSAGPGDQSDYGAAQTELQRGGCEGGCTAEQARAIGELVDAAILLPDPRQPGTKVFLKSRKKSARGGLERWSRCGVSEASSPAIVDKLAPAEVLRACGVLGQRLELRADPFAPYRKPLPDLEEVVVEGRQVGVKVRSVKRGGPWAKCGLERGDLVVQVAQIPSPNALDVLGLGPEACLGEQTPLDVERRGKRIRLRGPDGQ